MYLISLSFYLLFRLCAQMKQSSNNQQHHCLRACYGLAMGVLWLEWCCAVGYYWMCSCVVRLAIIGCGVARSGRSLLVVAVNKR